MSAPTYSTFVLRHKTEADERRVFGAIMRRWPMAEGKRTSVSAWAMGDTMSVQDAVRMALECRCIDQSERIEMALDLLELTSWDQCLAKFAEWDTEVEAGELIDARLAKASPSARMLVEGGE